MENIFPFITTMLGLIVRIGLPVALTVLLVVLLRWLDERWQAEGGVKATVTAKNTRCWDIHHCSEQQRASCTAYEHPEMPCWQFYRNKDGVLREQCLGCQVFLKAPVSTSH